MDKSITTESVDWMIVYEDAYMENEYFHDEETARRAYDQRGTSWNCHLFKRVESNHD